MNQIEIKQTIESCLANLRRTHAFDEYHDVEVGDNDLEIMPSEKFGNCIYGVEAIFAVLNAYKEAFGIGYYISTKNGMPVIRAYLV